MDGRRRQWIPLSADFPFDTTGTRLLEEFGNDGIAIWVAFLTACKRAPIQGRIAYGSEAEGWAQLGIDPVEGVTLETFWTATGRMKKTRRTRRGRITNVVCTVWGDWNEEPRTGKGRRQSPRSEPKNTRQLPDDPAPEANGNRASERESERDSDSDVPQLPAERWARRWCQLTGQTPTRPVVKRFYGQVHDFIQAGGEPTDDLLRAAIEKGIQTPGGWGFVTASPLRPELGDCSTCDNRRVIAVDIDGGIVSVDDPDMVSTERCGCTERQEATS